MAQELVLPDETTAKRIHWIQGDKVMLAHDLARLCGVPTKRLNEAAERNMARFPVDLMFQFGKAQWAELRSRTATSRSWGGRRVAPFAFTEHGVLMLSSVLNSDRAIAVNIGIMRVFVPMNRIRMNDRELLHPLARMGGRQRAHEEALQELCDAVKQLMEKPAQDRKRSGYRGAIPFDASLTG